ncbi:MAG: tetratricopeptide repeat protein [Nitrospirota bacterium]
MAAVTYPNEKVINFITAKMIPVQVSFDAQPIAADFTVKWTPTVITLDSTGKEHHRTVGFLAPEEFIPSLLLGMAKVHFDGDQFENALETLNNLLTEYPESDSAPEAIYLRGVCLYKSTHDAKPLKEAYETLNARDPKGEWTKRAYPYRLL